MGKISLAYQSKQTVTKNSSSTVYSGITGTRVFQCQYNGESTKGTLQAKPQYYHKGTNQYKNDPFAGLAVKEGASGTSHTSYLAEKYLWRLKLHDPLARGKGWIKGK